MQKIFTGTEDTGQVFPSMLSSCTVNGAGRLGGWEAGRNALEYCGCMFGDTGMGTLAKKSPSFTDLASDKTLVRKISRF